MARRDGWIPGSRQYCVDEPQSLERAHGFGGVICATAIDTMIKATSITNARVLETLLLLLILGLTNEEAGKEGGGREVQRGRGQEDNAVNISAAAATITRAQIGRAHV